jgi:hypothetical protein
MERKAFLELNLPIEVFYVHDPGEQAARDCAPVPFSFEVYEQANGRITRKNQENNVIR